MRNSSKRSSGVGRIDNDRPILKVTLCVAESPESGSHTISSIHLASLEGLRSLCTPCFLSHPPPPLLPIWRGDAKNPSDAVDRFKRFWACLRVDEDGHSDKRIPRRRNPRFETADISVDRWPVTSRPRGDRGSRREGEGGPSRRWTGWKSVEITGALPFFLLTANRKRIIGRLIGLFGVICIVAGFPRDGGYNGVGWRREERAGNSCFEHRLTQ